MTPVHFKECNVNFGAPAGLESSQVMTIPAFRGVIGSGSLDGIEVTVVAWRPTERELERLLAGDPIFISFIGGLPPHFPCVSFLEATNPA
jgi:hypothetical protein